MNTDTSRRQLRQGDVRLAYAPSGRLKPVGSGPATVVRRYSPADASIESGVLALVDNLHGLEQLASDNSVNGQVRLIYVDPPYATNRQFESLNHPTGYADHLQGADYVEFLRMRFALARDLLAPDGSIYVHIDQYALAWVKILLDEIFGPQSFRNLISRRKCNAKNGSSRTYGNVQDFMLFYTKGPKYLWNRPMEPRDDERIAKDFPFVDAATGRRYARVPIYAPGVRHTASGATWRGMSPPPGKHWQFTPSTLDELDSSGLITWSATGNPRRKIFADERPSTAVSDMWDYRDARHQSDIVTGYPTEKNQQLLERIVAASSNEDDLVLDFFCGSGTTLAAAQKLGRRWIGFDNSASAVAAAERRLVGSTTRMDQLVNRRPRVNQHRLAHLQAVNRASVVWSRPSSEAHFVVLEDASIANRADATFGAETHCGPNRRLKVTISDAAEPSGLEQWTLSSIARPSEAEVVVVAPAASELSFEVDWPFDGTELCVTRHAMDGRRACVTARIAGYEGQQIPGSTREATLPSSVGQAFGV